MTDVVKCVCRFTQQNCGVVRITAHVFATNPASARVLEKCGFVYEGLLRKYYRKNGEYLHARLFALVSDQVGMPDLCGR
ncbi:hypothetical protein Pla8534_37490 [Lignipirellula cremea]|uniref:N-acetyltransferase domain-containing protein n=1 Tax=Lignipirellula cremea TaxID=2528010 RepID=A0A518DVR9_9BACT|nr:hypothetical protein Pla8534_37490 [Lignipirellula cremea]